MKATEQDSNAVSKNVSDVVNLLLARDRMTRHELAEAVGISGSAVTRSMSGERTWRVDEIPRLAEVFDVPINTLFRKATEMLSITRYRQLASV